MQKVLEIRNFALSLHSQLGGNLGCIVQKNAEIAQLVEHNLAKVGVASSSLVFRSKAARMVESVDTKDLKSCEHCVRAGSSPARSTE